ncbi:MAG: ATP-binding protein [Candidatus Omnitrophica bacterium]|nr:ATP-binding protein [Candidatus Omnitrophota bacterium]MDD5488820.1 ATP-binding protein [Candidatus Omnitrophota bacterium]
MFIEPVFGKKFFGREEILGTLHKRVTALKGGYRQNIALTGPMLAGKSSILRHFLNNVKDQDIMPIYIELDGEDFRVFCDRFIATLLYRYLKAMAFKVDGDVKALAEEAKKTIPVTIEHIDTIYADLGAKRTDNAYEALLNLTSVFKAETGKNCIVILDEFQNMSHFKLKRPFQVFGRYIMTQKNTMYIVSSSQKTLLKEILSRKLSLLFGNFEVIEVGGFDDQTARSFILDKVQETQIADDIRNYLIQVTGGNPFYLETLSKRFEEHYRKKKDEVRAKECFLDAFADLLYESSGVLNQYFTNNINFFIEKKTRKKFLPLLLSLASGNSTAKAIHKDLGRMDGDLGKKLQKLIEMDLVFNSGVFYKLSDKLFEFWLKYVYMLKTRSMIDDMDIKYIEFKKAVGDEFTRYQEFRSKGHIGAMRELLDRFSNEKVKFNLNCRIMPGLSKVHVGALDATGNVHEMVGETATAKWIYRAKLLDKVDEQDVLDLMAVKMCKNSRKPVKKVLITLKGIEQNAFLLAKEHNIWIWDIAQLNHIMRLYNMFEIVI